MDKQTHGYVKKTIILYVETSLGDHWQNTQDCEFVELKGQDGYVVEEKE